MATKKNTFLLRRSRRPWSRFSSRGQLMEWKSFLPILYSLPTTTTVDVNGDGTLLVLGDWIVMRPATNTFSF
jgi:hypothetical protein